MRRTRAIALLLGIAGCGESVAPVPAVVTVTPSRFDLGSILVGDERTVTATLTTTQDLTLGAPRLEGKASDAFALSLDGTALGADAPVTATIRFAPAADVEVDARIDFGHGAILTVTATGALCPLRLETWDIDLGDVVIGDVGSADVLVHNDSDELVIAGSTAFCSGKPWIHELCAQVAGPRFSFITNEYELDPGPTTLHVLHRPRTVGTARHDSRLVARADLGGALCDRPLSLTSRAVIGDLECDAEGLANLPAPADACRDTTIRCTNRSGGPLTIQGWRVQPLIGRYDLVLELEASSRVVLAPDEPIAIDLRACGASPQRGRVVIEGDFAAPASGVLEFVVGFGP